MMKEWVRRIKELVLRKTFYLLSSSNILNLIKKKTKKQQQHKNSCLEGYVDLKYT